MDGCAGYKARAAHLSPRGEGSSAWQEWTVLLKITVLLTACLSVRLPRDMTFLRSYSEMMEAEEARALESFLRLSWGGSSSSYRTKEGVWAASQVKATLVLGKRKSPAEG